MTSTNSDISQLARGASGFFRGQHPRGLDHDDCLHNFGAAAWWLLGDRAHVDMEDEGEIGLWMVVMLTGTSGKILVQIFFFSVLFVGRFLFKCTFVD